ncbi:YeeE/YedE family protein [Aureispira anguillae]|uniref:YeeE/YedE family protein n=1 Tax=Aureispira anguillae TaxID=2864201 RepID=A0A915YLR3_9BACT|nr:YeeE/YedE family protein [Aureispira anguillae]BDS15553.1 YeeE/YedE family protein [Aureispira anguillae]
MKGLKYIISGILFGIVMTKSEAISWFRIQEMFLFQSIHMYGIIGVAVILGILQVAIIKKKQVKDIKGNPITFCPKNKSIPRYLFGGIIFGLGWAMTGACPGPMYTLVGHGLPIMLVIIASALLGTLTYGMLRSKLPH